MFKRKGLAYHLGKTIPSVSIGKLSRNVSALTLLAGSSQSDPVQAAFSWFKELLFPVIGAAELPKLPQDQNTRTQLCSTLQAMGLDITGYRNTVENGRARILIAHAPTALPSYELPFEEESGGTRKLLSILPSILAGLKQGQLVAADDLDSLLHPHLLRCIIALFTNSAKNPHGSQLIFTSHNTAVLTPSILRRDEIWLSSRPTGQDAQLYPLSWYKKENGLIPRNDEAYGKQYLEGRYGASPRVSF